MILRYYFMDILSLSYIIMNFKATGRSPQAKRLGDIFKATIAHERVIQTVCARSACSCFFVSNAHLGTKRGACVSCRSTPFLIMKNQRLYIQISSEKLRKFVLCYVNASFFKTYCMS